jgi:hypothetical protein
MLAVGAMAGHHLNGTWQLEVDLGGQGGTATFELVEGEGGTLTGTYTGVAGTAPVTGKVNGADVEFSFDAQMIKVTYTGTYADGKLSGKCSYGSMGQGTFAGKKVDG